MRKKANTFKDDLATRAVQLAGSNKTKQERDRSYALNVLLGSCVIGLSCAVVVLSNIHTVVPVITAVDADGHVVKQEVANPETIAANEAVVQAAVHDFVKYCNTFDPNWRQHYADLCHLHSSEAVAKQYDAETSPDNSSNPYYDLGQNGRRHPDIRGITPLGKNQYQVSFKEITDKPGAEPQTEYYTALVRFTFTHKPLALGDRWENGLGFAATAYRKDQELSHK
jgi:type IV secretion system protein VirB8